MKMGRRDLAGVDERVDTVDDELGAGESEHGCPYACQGHDGRCESIGPVHGE